MKPYTKTGDSGTTSNYDGKRVPKDDSIIIAVGKIDSLLAALDSSVAILKDDSIKELIEAIQKKLWQTAGEISLGSTGKNVKDEVTKEDIKFLEDSIDKYNEGLTYFTRFRTESSVRLNETRIRCRELEVVLTPLLREEKIRPEVYQYINRLSDLLYVLACKDN